MRHDTTEEHVPLSKAAALVPGRPSAATLWRWATRGARGVRLQTVVVGGRRFTSASAVSRFIDELNREPPPPTSGPARPSDAVNRQLDALDI